MLARSVEVGVYQNSLEAGLAQAWLEEQGIEAEIDGLVSQSWLTGEIPFTGFRVMVAREDAERAAHVLADAASAKAPEDGEAATPEPDDEEAATPEQGDEEAAAPAASPAGREALGPTAALLLGIFVWGPFTLAVACVWAVTLLRSGAGRLLSRRLRWLLVGGTAIALAQGGLLLATGWPRESVGWWWGESVWGWVAIDVAFAAAALLGWLSALRRWPAE